jgi:hypothetical protein
MHRCVFVGAHRKEKCGDLKGIVGLEDTRRGRSQTLVVDPPSVLASTLSTSRLSPSRVPIYRGGGVLVDEQASPTVALFLRIDPGLHAQIKLAAADRQETVTSFVRRVLSNELGRVPAGQRVAEAIRRSSRRNGSSSRP